MVERKAGGGSQDRYADPLEFRNCQESAVDEYRSHDPARARIGRRRVHQRRGAGRKDEEGREMNLSREQVIAARKGLGWSRVKLSTVSGGGHGVIGIFENSM